MHAARLAEKLGIRRVLIPSGAGVGSAFGFPEAPVAYAVASSRYVRLDDTFDASLVNALFRGNAGRGRGGRRGRRSGCTAHRDANCRHALLRTRPRDHGGFAARRICCKVARQTCGGIREAYAATYGRTIPGLDTEIMNWTLRLAAAQQPLPVCPPQPVERPARRRGRRTLFSATDLALQDVATYRRDDLGPGSVIAGPAVIAEDETTTIVPKGYTARLNPLSAIMLEKDGPG